MKKIDLLEIIGEISDKHILEFANVKPKKIAFRNGWKTITAIAACLTILMIPIVYHFQNINQGKNYFPPIPTFNINNGIYELIEDDDVLSAYGTSKSKLLAEHNLPENIEPQMIGEYICSVKDIDDGSIHKVYDFKTFSGQSVLLLEDNGIYQYLIFCNYEIMETIDFYTLLQLYGFSSINDITELTVGKEKIIDRNKIEVIAKALSDTNAITWDQYLSKNNEMETKHPVRISLSGVNTDTIYFDFYRKEGIITAANTIYPLSEETIELLADFAK